MLYIQGDGIKQGMLEDMRGLSPLLLKLFMGAKSPSHWSTIFYYHHGVPTQQLVYQPAATTFMAETSKILACARRYGAGDGECIDLMSSTHLHEVYDGFMVLGK